MAVTIKWKDNSLFEKGHRIYKSSTYFTSDNLPAPLVDLSPDIEEYEDTASNAGENWYIVSAYILGYEVFSEPFIPGLTTVYAHDIFGDGSVVATYNFDGNGTDLGGINNLTEQGTISYVSGLNGVDQALDTQGNSNNYFSTPFTIKDIRHFSAWFKHDPSIYYVLCGSTSDGLTMTIGINSSNGYFNIEDNEVTSTFYRSTEGYNLLIDNDWNHVYMDWKNTKLYVNGTSVSLNNQNSGASNPSTTSWIIARGYTEGGTRVGPVMDQVRIFNRALTQQEVDTLYQEGV